MVLSPGRMRAFLFGAAPLILPPKHNFFITSLHLVNDRRYIWSLNWCGARCWLSHFCLRVLITFYSSRGSMMPSIFQQSSFYSSRGSMMPSIFQQSSRPCPGCDGAFLGPYSEIIEIKDRPPFLFWLRLRLRLLDVSIGADITIVFK